MNGIGCFVVVCSESGMTFVGNDMGFVDCEKNFVCNIMNCVSGEMNYMDVGRNFVLRHIQVVKGFDVES